MSVLKIKRPEYLIGDESRMTDELDYLDLVSMTWDSAREREKIWAIQLGIAEMGETELREQSRVKVFFRLMGRNNLFKLMGRTNIFKLMGLVHFL